MLFAVYTHRRSTERMDRFRSGNCFIGLPTQKSIDTLGQASWAVRADRGSAPQVIMLAEALIMLFRVAGIALALVCAGAARNNDNAKPAEARGENESVTIT